MNGVGCVIVTFHPCLRRLAKALEAVLPQVDRIALIDNGSPEPTLAWLYRMGCARVFPLGANLGLAAAQNVGIRWCKRQGCRYVLFLDQDSIPHPSMVKGLLQALNQLVAQGQRIAAVGPRYRDPRTGATSRFIRFGWGRTRPVPCGDIVPVDFLIASGMLVPMSTLEAVGGMDEGLAIDHVDTEWLLRARALGYRPYGVCAAWMEHQLGEGGTRWLGRVIPRHRASRYYYIFRNSLLLYRRSYAPIRWISGDVVRLAGMLLDASRRDRKMMGQGLRDGVRGIQGVRSG